jgi:multidrug resistance protein, MATE family
MLNLMNIIFVGQSDDPLLLAGVGMGSMLINIFVFAESQGLNGTIEYFVSRSFGHGNSCMEIGNETEA